MTCSCPLCVEEAAATAAWKKHGGSVASFIKDPPPHVDPFASLEIRWALGMMLRYPDKLQGYDRLDDARREVAEVFSPKRKRGRASAGPFKAVVAELKIELREALMRALRSGERMDAPPLWPKGAGSFEEARAKWKKCPLSPGTAASLWLYEIEYGRGAGPPQEDQLVDLATSLVDSLRQVAQPRRRPRK